MVAFWTAWLQVASISKAWSEKQILNSGWSTDALQKAVVTALSTEDLVRNLTQTGNPPVRNGDTSDDASITDSLFDTD